MLPLRSSYELKKFPKATLVFVSLWMLADLWSRLASVSRLDFLLSVAFIPRQFEAHSFVAAFFHPHFFSLFIGLLYAWVFSPAVFERRGVFVATLMSLSAVGLSLYLFHVIHPMSSAPLLCPEALLGGLLGSFLRRDIWGSVTTFVVGPGWIRILEVPSYVLFFFWLFYLFLSNLFLPGAFSDAPMLYLLPLVSTLWGFTLESVILSIENKKSL